MLSKFNGMRRVGGWKNERVVSGLDHHQLTQAHTDKKYNNAELFRGDVDGDVDEKDGDDNDHAIFWLNTLNIGQKQREKYFIHCWTYHPTDVVIVQ